MKIKRNIADLNPDLYIIGQCLIFEFAISLQPLMLERFWINNALNTVFKEILLFNDFQNPHDPILFDSLLYLLWKDFLNLSITYIVKWISYLCEKASKI